MQVPDDLHKNRLLACLPNADWRRWEPFLELVQLPLGKVLHEPNEKILFVFFPTNAVVSLQYVLENGSSAEMALVGSDGMVGISIFMDESTTPSRAVVQSAGMGYRLCVHIVKRDFDTAGPVMHLMLRYTQALLTQMYQKAVCNRQRSLDQQLCYWLLLS